MATLPDPDSGRRPVPADRFVGCLLGLAVGDALGAPFEGVPADFVYFTQGAIPDLLDAEPDSPLTYTDDTQMTIGLAETLAEHGRVDTPTLCRQFAANYEPHRGYGHGARQILECIAAGGDHNTLAETIFPGGSFGNGAAMRVAPVGLMFGHDLDRVAAEARMSAWPTHRHPLGVEGAELLALAIAVAAEGPPLDRRRFYDVLTERCHSDEFAWQLRAARKLRRSDSLGFLGNSLPAHRSVVTAIACFTVSPGKYEDIVARAISLGDDTDTLAAMAGGLSGAHLGAGAIPARWLDRLENGPRGRDYISRLGERLHTQYSAAIR